MAPVLRENKVQLKEYSKLPYWQIYYTVLIKHGQNDSNTKI